MGINIVLLGPPGAGKGTQGSRLAVKLGEPHIASGDIFRAIREQQSPLAREVQKYMERGEYVPDELTIQVVMERLAHPDAAGGYILDGFPRTEPQAEALDGGGWPVDLALFLDAPAEVLVARIARRYSCPSCHAIYEASRRPPSSDMLCRVCGAALERRADDAEDVVRERLRVYAEKTLPLVEYYRSRGTLVAIDGAQPVGVVERVVDDAVMAAAR